MDKRIFRKLRHLAQRENMIMKRLPLQASAARIIGNRIALANTLRQDEVNYNLAHELAHHFLHYDKGDIIHSANNSEYEEQADRAAIMLLKALSE